MLQGYNRSFIPVSIIGDSVPELNESFSMILTAVEVVGSAVENTAETPVLGPLSDATVVIAQNDDPHGRFVLTASNGENEIRVMESDNFGVSLTVDRQGGAIGDVQVAWAVIPENSTATEGIDYAGLSQCSSIAIISTGHSYLYLTSYDSIRLLTVSTISLQ